MSTKQGSAALRRILRAAQRGAPVVKRTPRTDARREKTIAVRVSRAEHAAAIVAAREAGFPTVSEWLRSHLPPDLPRDEDLTADEDRQLAIVGC